VKTRPIGVTIFASLFALNVVLYLALAVLAALNHPALVAVLHALSPSGAGPEAMHAAMGHIQPFYYSAMVVITGALAVGFWKLHNWARIVVLGMIELSLLLMVVQIRPLLVAPTGGAIVLTLVRAVVSVWCLWYLFRRPVRNAFRQDLAPVTGA
jgi:hypothetical protein